MLLDELFIRKTLRDVSILNSLPSDPIFVVDSRKAQKGTIFVALAGKKQDGHAFIKDALINGASGIMIAAAQKKSLKTVDETLLKKVAIITVEDPMQALYDLAIAWR